MIAISRLASVLALWPCLAAADPKQLTPELFAPKQTWSYSIPAKPPAAVATPTRDEMIEDIAYLEHALDEAWAPFGRSTVDSFRARLHEVPLSVLYAADLCTSLAFVLEGTGIKLALDSPCNRPAPPHEAPGALDSVPANRNYLWRIDRARDHEVGILTIGKFVDPKDPGWDGFAAAMKEVSTTELLIVDVQHASGDDPRVGFAVLAALGLDHFDGALPPAVFRDGPIAKTARANAHPSQSPRSRTLWKDLGSQAEIKRIAREVVPGIGRQKRFVRMYMLIGPDCGRACQLIVGLVGTNLDPFRGTFDDASGDEPGTIRLPHSGIVVTFPTVSYGPFIGPPLHRKLPADYARTLLAGLHATGHSRAQSRARGAVNCAKLPLDRKVLVRKIVDCPPNPLPAKFSLVLSVDLDAETARRFLRTCPGLDVGWVGNIGDGADSQAMVGGDQDAIARALAAPFVQHGDWGCEPSLWSDRSDER